MAINSLILVILRFSYFNLNSRGRIRYSSVRQRFFSILYAGIKMYVKSVYDKQSVIILSKYNRQFFKLASDVLLYT